jgi:hypothetical protein
MSYSDFTLEAVKKNLHLHISSREDIFNQVAPLSPSAYLQETLAYNVPFALASNTEKSRSEMIITPILLELTKKFPNQISLFSGVEFNIDPSQGLSGNCDFIISRSPELLLINAPIIIVVEAKKENIKGGLGQCIVVIILLYLDFLFVHQEDNHKLFLKVL